MAKPKCSSVGKNACSTRRAIAGLTMVTALMGARAGAAQGAGDAGAGARLFLQCRACHAVGADQPSGVGPNLNSVVGAKAGTKTGYAYSPALAQSGLVWTPVQLDAWLREPTAVVPGTKMAFAGVRAPQARQDLIAYLMTLKR